MEAARPAGKYCARPINRMGDSPRAVSNQRKGSRFPARPLNQPRGFEPGTSSFRGGRFAHCATWTPFASCERDLGLIPSHKKTRFFCWKWRGGYTHPIDRQGSVFPRATGRSSVKGVHIASFRCLSEVKTKGFVRP